MQRFGGCSVLAIHDDYRGDTYRAVYAVRFPTAIYMLHVFKKKSKKVHRDSEEEKTTKVAESTGNIFGDLGFADPMKEQTKARLMLQIYRVFLTALGHDIEITLRPTRREHGQVTVLVA
jgi:hypothetical protein